MKKDEKDGKWYLHEDDPNLPPYRRHHDEWIDDDNIGRDPRYSDGRMVVTLIFVGTLTCFVLLCYTIYRVIAG